jgi:hypothetical protein
MWLCRFGTPKSHRFDMVRPKSAMLWWKKRQIPMESVPWTLEWLMLKVCVAKRCSMLAKNNLETMVNVLKMCIPNLDEFRPETPEPSKTALEQYLPTKWRWPLFFWISKKFLRMSSSSGLYVYSPKAFWMIVSTPPKKIWVRELGWLFPIYGKIKFMFQTTNQHSIRKWI